MCKFTQFYQKIRHSCSIFFEVESVLIVSGVGFLNKFVYFCGMDRRIEILKGVHPGQFLRRELGNRKIKSGSFAESIGEHPQTLSAIICGRRSMNTPLSLRIERALGLDEGFLMTLQVFYDIAEVNRRDSESRRPDLTKFRKVLFWDVSIDSIDFVANRRYVINRVFERGTSEEICETLRFYGRDVILKEVDVAQKSPFADAVKANLKMYLGYEF